MGCSRVPPPLTLKTTVSYSIASATAAGLTSALFEHTRDKEITHATPEVGEVRELGGKGERKSKM
jgi:hypothetical protein